LRYYRKKLSDIKTNLDEIYKSYPAYIDVKDYEETKEILGLIEKYYELTDKIKEDTKSDKIKEDTKSDKIKEDTKSDKIKEDTKSNSSKN
jgi:hypothetical protein